MTASEAKGTATSRPVKRRRDWGQVVRHVWNGVDRHNISLNAAGVAFWGLLAIFPALGALVSIYGLILNPEDVQRQIATAQGLLPDEVVGLLSNQLHGLVATSTPKLGISLAIGLALALWTARSGASGLISALNIAYDEAERRSLVMQQLIALAMTGGAILLGFFALVMVAILPIVIGFLPIPDSIKSLLSLVRWPVLAGLCVLALGALYRFGPCRDHPNRRWISWGSVIATLLWLIGSAGFSFYASEFGSYDKMYGSLGAVVILLLWFWLSAYIVLIGAEIDAESEHRRQGGNKGWGTPPSPKNFGPKNFSPKNLSPE
ncbi:MAG TPA: YihY/virulence factor BrkB family protein [Stellaceae bacterium]|nr:YihY/virulence factor BrkB family protein [Stellaceae bacterium]